jgi:rhodanese-related sulfurtransferase
VLVLVGIAGGLGWNALRAHRLPMRLPAAYYELESKATPLFLKQARRLFDAGQAVFVDARPADVYAEGQIEGAYSLPLDRWEEIYPALSGWIAGHRIVIYAGENGVHEADDLARALASRKVSDSLDVYVGGFEEWKEAGLPLRMGPDPTWSPEGDDDEIDRTGSEPADSTDGPK